MTYKKQLYKCKYKAVYQDDKGEIHTGYATSKRAFTDKRWRIRLNLIWIITHRIKAYKEIYNSFKFSINYYI